MVIRTCITIPEELFDKLRKLSERSGVSRSKIISEALRLYLAEEIEFEKEVAAIIIYSYNPHRGETVKRLIETQHEMHDEVPLSFHIHVSEERCMEAALFRGAGKKLNEIADKLSKIPGVHVVKAVKIG